MEDSDDATHQNERHAQDGETLTHLMLKHYLSETGVPILVDFYPLVVPP